MMAPNPALAKLHGLYQPPPPPWTPQTPGWFILFGLIALTLVWLAIRFIRKWLADRYRREALHAAGSAPLNQLPVLLKRTALAAWPRDKVASLNGAAWLRFLDESAGMDKFQSTPGSRIEELALEPDAAPSTEDEQALRAMAAEWIRRHRVQA
jgi:Domain of unknown function (DUF4381)